MVFSLSEHVSKSFEMGKKMISIYWNLLLKFIGYLLAFFLVIFLGISEHLSTNVLFLLFLAYLVLLLIIFVKGIRYEVAKIKAVEAVDKGKGDVDAIWKEAGGNLSKWFFLNVVLFLLTVVGLVLFVIPGVIALVWLSFAHFAAFLRGQDIFGSISYSKRLVNGHFWLVLVRGFFVCLLGFVIMSPSLVFESKLKERAMDHMSLVFYEEAAPIENYGEIELEEIATDSFFNGKFLRSSDPEDLFDDDGLMTEMYIEVLREMKLALVAYFFYSLVTAFFFMCFAYPYWYVLFKKLEKTKKII